MASWQDEITAALELGCRWSAAAEVNEYLLTPDGCTPAEICWTNRTGFTVAMPRDLMAKVHERCFQMEIERRTGAELIAAERKRQIDQEGFTAEHDARWVDGELIEAAEAYIGHAEVGAVLDDSEYDWPWDHATFKPGTKISDLVKAGALIAAEIDRRKATGKVE